MTTPEQPQQQPQQPRQDVPPRQDEGTMMLNAVGARGGQQPVAQPQAQPQPQGQQPPQAPQAPPQQYQHQQPPVPHQPQPQPGQHAAGPPHSQLPGSGYVSPIPVRRAHLGHALASEWTKIKSVRSTVWTLGVMILLVVGIGALTGIGISASGTNLGSESPLGFGMFGMLLGLMCVITLGVLCVSSEYGTGMIRTTLTACPSRARVLAAKAIVFFLLSFVVTAVTTAVVALLLTGMLSGQGGATPDGSEWFKATIGVSLYVAMIGLLALAVGALLRHSAGAITIMIGLVLLPLVLALFMMAESLSDLREWLFEYSIPSQLGVMYSNAVASSGPSGWEPLWIMTGLTAVVLGGAFVALNQRDV
ncbi:ABC transporter permease subunit [Streptomyces sp. NPDC053560]|uniref:ABC transporter permease subunit n=1 Tax=Streptomyces sp. NPDC053560 TaxID=3365711 RepID=UPI0037CDB854